MASEVSIAHRAVEGAMWSTIAGLVARALGLVGTVLIARFLRPDDYGAVQNAAVVVATGSQLASLGVGPYIIAFPRAGRAVAFHATFLHVTIGALALGLVWWFADRLGPALNAPTLAQFVPGLALSVFLDRITFMAERPVVRDLGFGVVSISRTAGDLIFTAVAVATVWAGAGAMGVVYGNLARSTVRLVLLLRLSSWREWALPAPLRASTFKTLVSYGSLVSVKAGAEFGTRRWDNLLIARYFGPGVAGNYILAYNLADLPAIQIGEQIGDVLLATFGRVDPANRAAAVVRATRLMALVMAPLSVGLGAVGPSLAAAFFPPSWTLLGPMLTLLPIMLLFRPIGAVYAGFLFGVRGPKPVVIGEVVGLVSMLLGLALAGRHDPLLFVAMIGVAFLVRLCVLMALARLSDDVSIRAAVAGLLPILAACVPMFLAVRGLHAALLPWQSPAWSLVLEIAAGALVYAITVPIFARAAVRDALGLVRAVLARRLPRFAGAR